MLENGLDNIVLKSYSAGLTLSVMYIDKKMGFRDIVNGVMAHKGNGMSPGDYMLLFIMNCLSEHYSKNRMVKWLEKDYASVIFYDEGSQNYWNVIGRFSDEASKRIQYDIRDRIMELGYGSRNIFVDASNMYTFMEENYMALNWHNKKLRYGLNQISYYIAANYDYIPLYG
jgi:transposase